MGERLEDPEVHEVVAAHVHLDEVVRPRHHLRAEKCNDAIDADEVNDAKVGE